jgi:hypothetical protein
MAGDETTMQLSVHQLAFIYAAALLAALWIGRKIANCICQSQRTRLRDAYENEYRLGTAMTNRLLLPSCHRV